ncbi:MAG: asparagine synthase (glutamine-hydrolyzing) [Bacteroidetes bacterium]|nr:asparagine synthase (glutamine-hydrolyzing) [Bacteroidota bacterium]
MCGILGTVNQTFDHEVLNLIQHRGPDSSAIQSFKVAGVSITYGFTRLSIQDLSEAGDQPMISEDGDHAIIFNGEIYNHLDLKKQLTDVRFRGHSDSETILYCLRKFGINIIKEFNGIFALSYLDKRNEKLYLVRDPFGIKPLYYRFEDGVLSFSSELKTLLHLHPGSDLDYDNLYTFLKLRYNPSPQTLFKQIKKLEPGHFVVYDLKNKSLGIPKFYSYVPESQNKISEEEALEGYDQHLNKAIERQLLSDVPISILLSGGVDSALLTCIAQQKSTDKFSTYTAGFSTESEANEHEDARRTAEILGTDHHEVIVEEEDFFEYLPKFIKIIEEPLGSQSIVPMYYLAEAIHGDGFKVTLSGQGVDEPWGGYAKYNLQNLFDNSPNKLLSNFKFLKRYFKEDKVRRGFNSITESDRVKRFIETCSVYDEQFLGKITSQEFLMNKEQVVEDIFNHKFDYLSLNSFDASNALMYFDTRMNLPDDLLLYTDKISMHHSLEVRVPFLDIELMKFVESLPGKHKVSLFGNKKLHKKLSEKYLPKEIIYRKKKGFRTPRKEWFKTDLGHKYEEMLMEDKGIFGDVFDREQVSEMFKMHRNQKVNYEKQIYLLINLYYWLQIFVENKNAAVENTPSA